MPDSLTIYLVNKTTSSEKPVYAYITGLAIQHSLARVFVKSDSTHYFPQSPPSGKILQPLTEDVAIPLGPPNASVSITIPQIAGGRIWFSSGTSKLTFLLNPAGPGGGAALVEPSVLNPSNPNSSLDFTFCEFTLNSDQLFANISYVDFVARLPIALTLETFSGEIQHVSGMSCDALSRIAEALAEQTKRDKWPWEGLVVRDAKGEPLRILNPTHGNAVGANFAGYFEPLVEAAWERYRERPGPESGSGHQAREAPAARIPLRPPKPRHLLSKLIHRSSSSAASSSSSSHPGSAAQPPGQPQPCKLLKINTQCQHGIVTGSVPCNQNDMIIAGESFTKPTTSDIFSCNSGPFTTGPSPLRNAIIPRLAASFQRSTIAHACHGDSGPVAANGGGVDDINEHPSSPSTFYKCPITNHYSRIVHEHNLDGKGYAFAYDDVQPDGGEDQSGKVNAGDPKVWIVEVGGRDAYVGDRMP